MTKRFILALLASAVFFLSGCNDFLSQPPGSVTVSLEAEPTATPGIVDCAINWKTNVETKHILEYGTETGVYTAATPLTSAEATDHTASLDSLLPSTTYYYRVRSYYQTYQEADSTEYSFTTQALSSALALATGPTITSNLTSVTIDFSTNYATMTTVEYGTVSGVYTENLVLDASTTSHSRTISGLTQGTTYYYRIHGYSDLAGNMVTAEYTLATTSESSPTLAQRTRGIWIVGGCSVTSVSSWTNVVPQIDLYDPVTATWYSPVATLFTPVSFAAVGTGTLPNGHRVLIIAGGFDSSGTVRDIVQRYDINDGVWLPNGATMLSARANVNGSSRNNKLYVIGGTTANASAGWASSTTYITQEYDIATNTWADRAGVTTGSERATAVFDDTVLYSGGRTNATTASTANDGYLITQNSLTTGTTEIALPAARTGHSMVTYTSPSGSSVVVVLGGFTSFTGTPANFILHNGATGTLITTNTVIYLRYPFTAPYAWTPCTNLPANVAFGAAVVYGNTLYYFGGTSTYSAVIGRNVAYSTVFTDTGVASNAWSAIGNMPLGRYGHAAVRFQ